MAKTARKTVSGLRGTVYKTATGLHRAGVIDKATMREFDALRYKIRTRPPLTN